MNASTGGIESQCFPTAVLKMRRQWDMSKVIGGETAVKLFLCHATSSNTVSAHQRPVRNIAASRRRQVTVLGACPGGWGGDWRVVTHLKQAAPANHCHVKNPGQVSADHAF